MIIRLKGADFSGNNIGTLDMWFINFTLTGVTSSNTASSVKKGEAYSTTFTIKDGYTIDENSVFTVNGAPQALTWSSNEEGGTATFSFAPTGDSTIVLKASKIGGGEEEEPDVPEISEIDITDNFVFTEGKMVHSSDGCISSFQGWVATEEYVDISPYSSITIKMSKTSSITTTTGLALYDADKVFISGIPHTDGVATYGVMEKEIEVTSDVKYIRTTYWSKTNANYKTEFGDFYCKAMPKA